MNSFFIHSLTIAAKELNMRLLIDHFTNRQNRTHEEESIPLPPPPTISQGEVDTDTGDVIFVAKYIPT
jgi:hypothetical protein